VVKFTVQKGHSGLGFLSITAEWVALTYDNLLASGHRIGVFVHHVVWFALFHGVVEFSHFSSCFSFTNAIKSCEGYVSVRRISSFSASFAASSAA
jgi:hypothetical protein